MTGEIGAVGLADARDAQVGEELQAHTLVWGAGLQGNQLVQSLGLELERGNRIAVGPELDAPRPSRRSSPWATSRRSPTRRRSRCCRSSARSRSSRASTRARPSPGASRQGDEAVQVPRQGHDGDDRARCGGRADARRQDDEGHEGPVRVGTVHLALLPTNEDRAKAIVDWAGAGSPISASAGSPSTPRRS